MGKYASIEFKTETVKTKGNIITFKEPFNWKGEMFRQILITEFKLDKKSGKVKIIGFCRDTQWFKSLDDLFNSIDWHWMEENIID